MSGSEPTQREIKPLITAESSTTITRSGSCRNELGVEELANAILIIFHQTEAALSKRKHGGHPAAHTGGSDQADFLELGRDDFLVERLHDVLVGAGMERARDMRHIVFGGAEHHLRLVAAGHPPEVAEKLVAIHDRHI